MGTFDVRVRISSLDGSLQEETAMLVDTGATFSLLPASTLRRLGVQEQLQVETQYATGQVETVPAGLAMMEIEGFAERVPVLISFGHEEARPLLGAHSLEAFRLAVDPVTRTLRRVRAFLT